MLQKSFRTHIECAWKEISLLVVILSKANDLRFPSAPSLSICRPWPQAEDLLFFPMPKTT